METVVLENLNIWLIVIWGTSTLLLLGVILCLFKGYRKKENSFQNWPIIHLIGQFLTGLLICIGSNGIPLSISYFAADAMCEPDEITCGMIIVLPLFGALFLVNFVLLLFMIDSFVNKHWAKLAGLIFPAGLISGVYGLLMFAYPPQ